MTRSLYRLLIVCAMVAIWPSPVWTETPPAAPKTVSEWLQREHAFLRRYLAVVQQATHDYSYGYKTPKLLMPITIDLFTGYVARIHEAEERFLYPALRDHMTSEQLNGLRLIEVDESEETGSVKGWVEDLEQYEAGHKKLTEVADTIDYLGRMINRHLVLQEQWVFPLLDQLTPKEQADILTGIQALERREFGAHGRTRYLELLSEIEGQIKAIAGRIW